MITAIMSQILIVFSPFELIQKKKATSMSLRTSVYTYLYSVRFLGPATAASVIILRYLWKF